MEIYEIKKEIVDEVLEEGRPYDIINFKGHGIFGNDTLGISSLDKNTINKLKELYTKMGIIVQDKKDLLTTDKKNPNTYFFSNIAFKVIE